MSYTVIDRMPMRDLPRNARFVSPGPAGVENTVFTPASEHPQRWVVTDQGVFTFHFPVVVDVTWLPEATS
jgi:hypothetical protein